MRRIVKYRMQTRKKKKGYCGVWKGRIPEVCIGECIYSSMLEEFRYLRGKHYDKIIEGTLTEEELWKEVASQYLKKFRELKKCPAKCWRYTS